jgi:hypothetical protein
MREDVLGAGRALRGVVALALLAGCTAGEMTMQDRVDQYATVQLSADLSGLSDAERQMLPLLIEAADQMDVLFWRQAYGDKDSLLATIDDPATRQYLEINYGPWDRLAGDEPFLPGVGAKPAGANLYPADMTSGDFEAATDAPAGVAEQLRGLYTLVRRGPDGSLTAVPYSEAFASELEIAAAKLREAAALAPQRSLRHYLELRAEALLSDDYQASDMAWMDMKDNTIEVVVGPIETYEDQLYKREMPGSDADLNAYDVVYVSGDANAGSKTIAINLPNDETVQLEKGTRRLQLKNAMRAKFDRIMLPITDVLIAEDQRQYVTFDAFFGNTMFHEVAHGLGVKNTINEQGTVRQALRDLASSMEEGKADILGLYMVTKLREQGAITEGDLRDNYVTFMAGIFRSIRFGASSAHGKANMVRFNFFQDMGAFARDEARDTYSVDFERMGEAMTALSEVILTLQGDGNYDGAAELIGQKGVIGPQLEADLDRLADANIPVDIVFEQGMAVLEGGN